MSSSPAAASDTLAISIVTYAPDIGVLSRCVASLRVSAARAAAEGLLSACQLIIVDNGPGDAHEASLRRMLADGWPEGGGFSHAYRSSGGNVGYGRGHNLALLEGGHTYHLVCNPDIFVEEDTLAAALRYCREHPDVGLLAPAVFGPDGERHYLCKRNPTVVDLFLRGFAPGFLKRRHATRLDRYEMRDLDYETVIPDVPYMSGCFMFLRGEIGRRLGGFMPEFFMYLEDADLTRRVLSVAHTAYVPWVKVTHLWTRGTHTSLKLRWVTVHSSYIYFRKWGVALW